jgi:hypothetical protein
MLRDPDCSLGNLPPSCRRLWLRSISRMKKLAATVFLTSAFVVVLCGCASPGPSPEQQTREAQQQREAERQQAEFRKGLPPVSNPGQGW